MSLPKTYVSGFHNEEEVKSMPYKRLGETDMEVSRLSLGGAAFSRLYGGLDDEEVIGTIKEAFQSGINYIDTAPYYGEGHSETLVGKGLKNVPREAFYISTKVGRYTCKYETMFDYSREKIHSRFETSLQLLGIKYVDIAVVHDVEFADIDQVLNEALPAVEELVKSGKVRYIAISGYPVSKLWEVVQKSKVKIDIVLSYSRETLIDTTLSKYADKFKSKGVGIINAAPLAMQMLTNKGPEVWHPANDDIKKLCLNASQYCKEKGVELGLLAIYHSMVKDEYATCLVGCNSKKLLKSNLNLVFQGLSQLEKDVLKHLKEKYFTLKEDLHWEGVEVSAYKKYMESIKQ